MLKEATEEFANDITIEAFQYELNNEKSNQMEVKIDSIASDLSLGACAHELISLFHVLVPLYYGRHADSNGAPVILSKKLLLVYYMGGR